MSVRSRVWGQAYTFFPECDNPEVLYRYSIDFKCAVHPKSKVHHYQYNDKALTLVRLLPTAYLFGANMALVVALAVTGASPVVYGLWRFLRRKRSWRVPKWAVRGLDDLLRDYDEHDPDDPCLDDVRGMPQTAAEAAKRTAPGPQNRVMVPRKGYVQRLVKECKAHFPTMRYSPENVLVVDRWMSEQMKEHGVRPTHVADIKPAAIVLALTPSRAERHARWLQGAALQYTAELEATRVLEVDGVDHYTCSAYPK